MDFPKYVSLTLTNRCNLRCQMCGQWSQEGYMHDKTSAIRDEMTLDEWKGVIDELAEHGIGSLLLRGGETFLFPGILDLMKYIRDKGMFISVDTNGTQISKLAADLVRMGGIHLTISVDGPEAIHDEVRGVKECFASIREGLETLRELSGEGSNQIGTSLNFTISPYSVNGLGEMPDVARSLGVGVVAIVPYYYFPEFVGQQYEQEMAEAFNCPAFSWRGFHHETSGVAWDVFATQYRRYLDSLGEVYNFPYMDMSLDEYWRWFSDPVAPVLTMPCNNVEKLIDIQPGGEVNFCVDFPDYAIGNVREASIEEIWNGERAERFRQYRRAQPLAVCYRCGAKYMSEME